MIVINASVKGITTIFGESVLYTKMLLHLKKTPSFLFATGVLSNPIRTCLEHHYCCNYRSVANSYPKDFTTIQSASVVNT